MRRLAWTGFAILAAISVFGLAEMLYMFLPDLNAMILYLAPLFIGLGLMTHMVLVSYDAVEKAKTRERALTASQERFEYLYKSSPVPYININRKGEIFLTNLAALRLFGTTEPELMGKQLVDFLEHESDSKMSIIVNQIQSRAAISDVELRLKTFAGETRWVLLSAFAYGNMKEQLVSMVDITRQKEVDQAKTEFVTLASHQLRTPIASTRWNFELLQEATPERTPEQAEYYERVNRNIGRLTDLVNDFLHVSKLELGTYATDSRTINLEEFLDSVIEELDGAIADREITIIREYEPKRLKLEIDAHLLKMAMTNLVSNAVKYTPEKGTVTVSYLMIERELRIIVRDTGIGIPVDERKKLFTRFYRATNAQEEHVEGTGLGLYIVKQVAEKLKGDITFDSTLGQGSEFTLHLPDNK